MSTDVMIAIVGGGPAGLSAAVHAAQRGVSHILLESRSQLFGTVHEFPKSKLVMAAPESTTVISDLPFEAGSREAVIAGWARAVQQSGASVRLNAEVTRISGSQGNFEIALADGETITAEYVVMATGVRGGARRLAIPGAEQNPDVQYQVDDPDEIEGEEVLVIGKGDSAIEDALALAGKNRVTMLFRGDRFDRAHPANARRVQEAIRHGAIRAYANVELERIQGRHLHFKRAA
jgi:thioredoxin reductase